MSDNVLESIKLIPMIFTAIFVLMSTFISCYTIIGQFSKIIGKPVKWVKNKEKDHELLLETSKRVDELQKQHEESIKQSIKHDEVIRNDLQNLTKMFIDKQIDDMRYEILDFASAISSGRNFSKEQFDHVISTDTKYQKILEENGLENGQVTTSMEVIKEIYKEKLKNGF